MPELTHDTAEDGFHEIQLSGKQLVFLFIVTTSVVVGVFLFGVLVGRGARDYRAADAPPAGTSESAPQPLPAAAAPPTSDVPVPAEDGEKDLSYNDRLTGSTTPPEKLHKAGEDAPAPASAAAPRAQAPAPAPAPKPEKQPAAPAASTPTSGRPGTWLVQVIATGDESVARTTVQKLVAKGYPAFLVNPAPGVPQPFYKVQVGRYTDRGEAEKVSLRIKKEEQFKPWILR